MKAIKKVVAIDSTLHYADPNTFHGWSKLEPNEQQIVQTECTKLSEALHQEAQSTLAQGEHLYTLRNILQPKKMFITFLDEIFSMSRPTAYRRIDLYLAATKRLPAQVIEMAIQRGTKITPQTLEENPPPKLTGDASADRIEISTYLSNLRSTRGHPDKSTETILKECVNFISTRVAQLPTHHKTRGAFLRTLVGMVLTKFGVEAEQNFSPIAIPTEFTARLGRPISKHETAA